MRGGEQSHYRGQGATAAEQQALPRDCAFGVVEDCARRCGGLGPLRPQRLEGLRRVEVQGGDFGQMSVRPICGFTGFLRGVAFGGGPANHWWSVTLDAKTARRQGRRHPYGADQCVPRGNPHPHVDVLPPRRSSARCWKDATIRGRGFLTAVWSAGSCQQTGCGEVRQTRGV